MVADHCLKLSFLELPPQEARQMCVNAIGNTPDAAKECEKLVATKPVANQRQIQVERRARTLISILNSGGQKKHSTIKVHGFPLH